MLTCKGTVVTMLLVIAIALFAVGNSVAAVSEFQVASTSLHVFRDGLIHVSQTITVDELASSVTLELLTDSVENVLILDNDKLPVDFTIEGSNITILSLGEQQVSIEYDTMALTNKDAQTWTLLTKSSCELMVSLPPNATLFYLSQMPSAINIVDSEIRLTLPPGNWEVSYTLPLVTQESENHQDTSGTTGTTASFDPLIILSIIAVAIAVAGVSALMFVKRTKKPNMKKVLKTNPQLAPDDQKIIEFLIEKGGTAFEAEIRERFPDMPRTSLWRLVRRLERLDLVEITKIGLENQVKLKK